MQETTETSLYAIVEQADRMVNAGIQTDESRMDRAYLAVLVHQGRAVVCAEDYLKFQRWDSNALQYFYPQYSQYLQSSVCFTRFQLPTGFVSADARKDGLVYVGSSNDIENFNAYGLQNFYRVKFRTELIDMLNHPITNPKNGNMILALVEGNTMEVYSTGLIKNLAVGAVWSDPTAMPDFNVNKDSYPIGSDLIPRILTYVYQTALGIEKSQVPDTISSSSESTPPAQFQQQRRR